MADEQPKTAQADSATPAALAAVDTTTNGTADAPTETNGMSVHEAKPTAPSEATPAKPIPTTEDVVPSSETPASTTATPASGKKSEKRKSTSAVPEHKTKKLNRKKSAVLLVDAKPGNHYWARLKGYPPWPAIIAHEDMLPETILADRPVSARRPDGSYREDYQEGGKNFKDRTYPVMYLGTYEFSWTAQVNLTPMKPEEVQGDATKGKKSKQLQAAYAEAEQWNDLDHYKSKLQDFARDIAEAEQAAIEEADRMAKVAEEKEAKKEAKAKRKSAGTGDVSTPKEKPSAKKRRKEADSDDEKPAKSPKSLKLSNSTKAPNGDSAPKTKAKGKQASTSKPAAKPEPVLSEEEKKEKLRKEILFFRHMLQKGFLTRDVPPKEEDMAQMATFFDALEKHQDIDGDVLKNTRVHKVLKGILKLGNIPSEDLYKFKERSTKLLEKWIPLLDEADAPTSDNKGGKVDEKDEEEKPDSTEAPVDTPMPDAPATSNGAQAPATVEPKTEDKSAAPEEPAGAPAAAAAVSSEAPKTEDATPAA